MPKKETEMNPCTRCGRIIEGDYCDKCKKQLAKSAEDKTAHQNLY